LTARVRLALACTVATACAASQPAPPAQPLAAAQLSKQEVLHGMMSARLRVADCYDRYKLSGVFNAQMRVEPDGRVSDVRWPREMAQSAQSDCLLTALRAIQFPAFAGPPMTFAYPFILR
jgi:hypothetical protein